MGSGLAFCHIHFFSYNWEPLVWQKARPDPIMLKNPNF